MSNITLKRVGEGLDNLVLILSGYAVVDDKIVQASTTSILRPTSFEEFSSIAYNVKAFGSSEVSLTIGQHVLTMEHKIAATLAEIAEEFLFEAADSALSAVMCG